MAEHYREPSRPQQQPSGSAPGPPHTQFQPIYTPVTRTKGPRAPPSGLIQGQDAEKYQAKYKDLKRKVKEIEKSNDELYYKVLQAKKQVSRLRLERGILYEKLSTMPASAEVHSNHGVPAMYNPNTSPHQSHHRPVVEYLPGPPVDDRSFGEYSRGPPPPNVRVMPGADGRPVPIDGPHGYSRHESSRQLPPLQHSIPPGPPPMETSRHPDFAGGHHSRSQHPSSSSTRQSRPPPSAQAAMPQHYTHMNPYSPPERDRHYQGPPLNESADQEKARVEYEIRRERERRDIVGDPYHAHGRRPAMPTPPRAHSSSRTSRPGYTPTGSDRDVRPHPEQIDIERARAREREQDMGGPPPSASHYSPRTASEYRESRNPHHPAYIREDVYGREREHLNSHVRGSRPPSPDGMQQPPRDREQHVLGRPPLRERTSSTSRGFPPSRSREDPTSPIEVPPSTMAERFTQRHRERERNGGPPSGHASPPQGPAYSDSGRKRTYHEMDVDEDRESEVASISAMRGNGRSLPHPSQRSGSPDEHD